MSKHKPLVYTPPNVELLMEYNRLKRFQVKRRVPREGMYIRVFAVTTGDYIGFNKIRVMGRATRSDILLGSMRWAKATELQTDTTYDPYKDGYFYDTLRNGGYQLNSKTLAFVKKLTQTDHFTVWCLLKEKPHNEETFKLYTSIVEDERRFDKSISDMLDQIASEDMRCYEYGNTDHY